MEDVVSITYKLTKGVIFPRLFRKVYKNSRKMTPFLNLRSQLFLLLPSLQIEGVMEALKLTQTVMQQATQEVKSRDLKG